MKPFGIYWNRLELHAQRLRRLWRMSRNDWTATVRLHGDALDHHADELRGILRQLGNLKVDVSGDLHKLRSTDQDIRDEARAARRGVEELRRAGVFLKLDAHRKRLDRHEARLQLCIDQLAALDTDTQERAAIQQAQRHPSEPRRRVRPWTACDIAEDIRLTYNRDADWRIENYGDTWFQVKTDDGAFQVSVAPLWGQGNGGARA